MPTKEKVIEIFKAAVGRDPEPKDMLAIIGMSKPHIDEDAIKETFEGLKAGEEETARMLAKENAIAQQEPPTPLQDRGHEKHGTTETVEKPNPVPMEPKPVVAKPEPVYKPTTKPKVKPTPPNVKYSRNKDKKTKKPSPIAKKGPQKTRKTKKKTKKKTRK